jgi:hypothetical protein
LGTRTKYRYEPTHKGEHQETKSARKGKKSWVHHELSVLRGPPPIGPPELAALPTRLPPPFGCALPVAAPDGPLALAAAALLAAAWPLPNALRTISAQHRNASFLATKKDDAPVGNASGTPS